MNKKTEKKMIIASAGLLLLAAAMIGTSIFWINPAAPALPGTTAAPGVPQATGSPAALASPAPTPASTTKVTASAASVDGKGYATLQEAVDAAARGKAEGSVITLLMDVDLGDTSVVAAGCSITLNLNGYAVTGTADALIVLKDGASLAVEDAQSGGGRILNLSGTGCAIFVEDGDLTINSGTVETLAESGTAVRRPNSSTAAASGGAGGTAGDGGSAVGGGTIIIINGEPENPPAHTVHYGGTATCTSAPVCAFCGASYGVPLGHDFAAEHTVDLAATCTEAGSASRHCTRCGAVTDAVPIAPTGHSFEDTWTVAYAGHYHNPTCGHTLDAEATLYHLHFGGTATCTEPAVCEVCKAPYGLPLYHDFSTDWKHDDTKHWHICMREGCLEVDCSEAHFGGEATCTQAPICAVCGVSYGVPLGHDFETEFTVDKEATCSAAGQKSHHCTRCGAKEDVTILPPPAHNLGEWCTITPATCFATGTEKRVCNNPGCTYAETRTLAIDPNAHSWDWNWSKGVVTKPATCDQNGEMTFTCGNGCLHTQVIAILSSAHSHVVNIVQPANGTITVTYADSTAVASGTKVSCGTILTVTATPDTGYHTVANSVKAMASGVNRYIEATGTFAAKYDTATVTAEMAPNTYTINTGETPNITVAPGGLVTVSHGADQSFTITANEGYLIKDVFTGGTAGSLVYAVQNGALESYVYEFKNVTANQTLNVNFVPAYKITASAGSGGTISPPGVTKVANRADLENDGNQTYTIAPNEGYAIKDVKADGGSVGAVTTYTFTNVDAPHTIEAAFIARHTVTLSVVGGELGSVTGSTTTVDEGGSAAFAAIPKVGCEAAIHVDGVLKGTVSDGDGVKSFTYTFENVSAPHEITVCFAVKAVTTHAITSSASGGGAISPCGAISVTDGGNHTFTITPSTGFKVTDVLVDGVSVGPLTTYTFTNVVAPHTISAAFEQLTYAITASAGAGGTISNPGATVVGYGGSKTYTVTPSTGYKIKNVLVDGASAGAVATYTFNNVTAPHTISATFEALTASITASTGAGGTISPPGVTNVNQGDEKTYTIAPNANYRVADVRVDGVSVGAVTTHTFSNVTASHTIAATFEPVSYEITAPLSVYGSIGPRVSTFVPHGGSQTYTITPDTGYTVKDVKVDGVSVGAVTTYTFTNVTAKHSISATFGFAITVSAGSHGAISPASAVAEHGATQTFTITPDAGYQVDRVIVDGNALGAVFSYSFVNVTGTHTIRAEFKECRYSVTLQSAAFGNIVRMPSGSQAEMSQPINLKITPLTGYQLKTLTVTDSAGNSIAVTIAPNGKDASFTMPASNVTVAAEFEKTPYTVTCAATGDEGGGSVGVLTAGDYFYSFDIIRISVEPASIRYRLKTLTVKDASGNKLSYNTSADKKSIYFPMPASNVTVTAEFVSLPALSIWTWPFDSVKGEYVVGKSPDIEGMIWENPIAIKGILLDGVLLERGWGFRVSGPPTFLDYAWKTNTFAANGTAYVVLYCEGLDKLTLGRHRFTICFDSSFVDLYVNVVETASDDGDDDDDPHHHGRISRAA